jgi:hypothetical protein
MVSTQVSLPLLMEIMACILSPMEVRGHLDRGLLRLGGIRLLELLTCFCSLVSERLTSERWRF